MAIRFDSQISLPSSFVFDEQDANTGITGASGLIFDLSATFVGSGSVAQPQIVTGSGAFDKDLDAISMAASGVSGDPQLVTGSGAFTATIDKATAGSGQRQFGQAGSGIFVAGDFAPPIFVGSGIAVPSNSGIGQFNLQLNYAFVGTGGKAAQGVINTGDAVNLPPLEIQTEFAGAGVSTTDFIFADGSFAKQLDITFAGTATSVDRQIVAGYGIFGGLQLEITQVSAGNSNPAGTAVAVANLSQSIDLSMVGAGSAIQPQVSTASGSLTAGTLQVEATGIGSVLGAITSSGIFNLSTALTVSNFSGIGQALPPLPTDIGWEDDDVPWGGVQLGSKDLAPIGILADEFKIFGRGEDKYQDFFLERRAIVYQGGAYVEGTHVVPQLIGPEGSAIQISLGSHKTPNGPIDWEGPYDFVFGEDDMQDFAVTGKYLAVRFESINIPAWTLQGYEVQYEFAGKH